jgi:hypothetical protein
MPVVIDVEFHSQLLDARQHRLDFSEFRVHVTVAPRRATALQI